MVTDTNYVEAKITRCEGELRTLASTASGHQARIVAINADLAALDARAAERAVTLSTARSTVQRLTDAVGAAQANLRLSAPGEDDGKALRQVEKQLRQAQRDIATIEANAQADEGKDTTRRTALLAQRDQHDKAIMESATTAQATETVLAEAKQALGSAILHNVTEGIQAIDTMIAQRERELEGMHLVRNEQIAKGRGQLTDWPALVKVLGEQCPSEDDTTKILDAASRFLFVLFANKSKAEIDSQVLRPIWQVNSLFDFLAMNKEQLMSPGTVGERWRMLQQLLKAYQQSKA